MQRLHLFELEDLAWVPRAVRDGGTDLLDLMFARTGFYRPLVPKLVALVEATGERRLVDLCSGGGGGALAMRSLLREQGHAELELDLTDRYPSAAAGARVAELGEATVHWHAEPVDAFHVPETLAGIRTMYSALHHFRPHDVQRLIEAAVADGVPLAFFDVAAPPPWRKLPLVIVPLLAVVNVAALVVVALLLVPWVRPFRWSRLLLTYVVPAIPLLFAWDGMVSALRAYTPEELLALAHAGRGSERYTWEASRAGRGACLIGRPTGGAQ